MADLIAYLQRLPGDMNVVMSKDAEGNGFSPWCGEHSIGEYTPESTWAGDFSEYGDEAGSFAHPKPNAIVLWPIN